MTQISDIAYVKSGDAYIAYQTLGEGPIDLVFVPGFISHLEMQLEFPFTYLCGNILQGTKPGDLPIDQASKFTLAVNARIAKVLGLTIPVSC